MLPPSRGAFKVAMEYREGMGADCPDHTLGQKGAFKGAFQSPLVP
jgi:hypothetical protein